MSPIIGPRAAEKSLKTANAILKRCTAIIHKKSCIALYYILLASSSRNQRMFKMLGMKDFEETNVHVSLVTKPQIYNSLHKICLLSVRSLAQKRPMVNIELPTWTPER